MRNFVVSVDLSGEVDVGREPLATARVRAAHIGEWLILLTPWRIPASTREFLKWGPTSRPRKAISDSRRVTELMVPHSGQSLQLVFDANHGIAQFLPTARVLS